MNSSSTNEVIQNINILNQGDGENKTGQPNDDGTAKLVHHFMEGCKLPYYTTHVENRSIVRGGVMKNVLPTPCSFYILSLYFDYTEGDNEYLRRMKTDIPVISRVVTVH